MRDLAERNAQISIMRKIFSKASEVIVWLGEPSKEAIAVLTHFDFLADYKVKTHGKQSDQPLETARARKTKGRKIDRFQPEWSPYLLQQTELYTRNLDHPWFTRVWAIQEYVLAKTVVFQWGRRRLDSRELTDNVDRIVKALSSLSSAEQQQEEKDTIMKHLRGFRYMNWVKRTWDQHPEDITAFAHVVATAQEFYATEPRDKVFGLLALAPSSLRNSYLPDYRLTVDDVYLRLAEAMSLAKRVEVVVTIEHDNLGDGMAPDWLPEWIDELSLRVSDLSREPISKTGTIQSAVVDCLEIITINERPRSKKIHLTPSDISMYIKSLSNTCDALRSILSQATFIEVAGPTTLTTSTAASSTLHTVADDFSDSGYSSASSSAESTFLVADEIASHLLSHKVLQRLLSTAKKLEDRDDVLELYLRPCIRHLGRQLDTMASDFEELLVAQELRRHAPFVVRALIARLRQLDIDEDKEIKIQRASRIQRLLDEQTSVYQVRLQSRLHEVFSDKTGAAQTPYGTEISDDTGSPLGNGPLQYDLPKTALEKVKEFVTTGTAWMAFLYSIQYVVYRSPLEIIKSEVEHLIHLKAAERKITPDKEVFSFNLAIPSNDQIVTFKGHAGYERFRHLLSISGNEEHCYSTNCETYLKWAWPDTSRYLLKALAREPRSDSIGKRYSKSN